MKEKIKKLLDRYLFSDKFPIDTRVLNVVCLIGIIAAFMALLIRMAFGAVSSMALMLSGMIFSLGVMLVLGNRFRRFPQALWITLVIIGNVCFPFVFFLLGGADSGMSAFFVVSIVTVFFLLRGKVFAILLSLHLAVIIACYILGYLFPETTARLTPYQQMLDHIQAILVAGMYIGFAAMFQNRIYLTEKQRADDASKELSRQDKLLRAVTDTAAILLTAEEEIFEIALAEGMELLARCADVDHVNIWTNRLIDNDLRYMKIAEWEKTGAFKDPEKKQMNFSYREGLFRWESTLSRGECINGPVRLLPLEEQNRLELYGIKSILVIPIFMRGRFWGFVSFDDNRQERTFPEEEQNILRSGSLMMANAVVRNEMTHSLIHAREAALSSTKAKSNFLANMSHEMRTPMNAITGMTTIAKSSADLKRKDYCLNKIEDASIHLLGVINDILDMSKIEANKFELSLVDFNFEKMIRRALNVVNFRIDEKKQKFHVHIDDKIPLWLKGDDQRLAQVITNLLSNAVKFTPEEGRIRLETQLIKEDQGICTIRFEVNDTGIGISPEQISRVFSSFEQADSGTSRKFGGTGLGLAISKRIVEMMKGSIWVESELGKGSAFIFIIEIKRAEEKNDLLPAGINWNNLRILAVDDDPEILEFFEHTSKQIGFSCHTANSGEEALAMIEKSGAYDIYFVDWKMPGMDGIELSRRIKEQESEKSLVIMISATEWRSIEDAAAGAGVGKYLAKPLFSSSIKDSINECFGIKSQEAGPGQIDHFENYHLLLAEDVEINREIVIALLESTLLQIDCAENGAEAVKMFESEPEKYDMIFMDLQMPEMDGYEATRQIRQYEIQNMRMRIPIIAMTANVFQEDVQKCLAAGMNDHVGKPLNFDEVLHKLRSYLPKKG